MFIVEIYELQRLSQCLLDAGSTGLFQHVAGTDRWADGGSTGQCEVGRHHASFTVELRLVVGQDDGVLCARVSDDSEMYHPPA